ncbi:protein kintoun [Carassius gibelio]|uniref:protein kintoun n=1 Tax=Carassius gibelio TaxID=101364 RepID=UPI00227818C5|nr:protein kintoun [Carassius gibelio]
MDFSKLEEMNLTRDEINRFGEALKDEKFRELLNEYATEISDPENKRRYEEEITQLEKDRGTNVQFIHPEAHHVLKIRGAREKRFINICSNQLIDKPSCEAGRDRDGKTGFHWRLPFSLTPGRPDRDASGNSCVIHDVIFHPDALHAAENNKRLMELLHRTAIGGVEDSFHIKLDRRNIKQLKMKYKGVPQAAVIRRPIPGHEQQQSTRDLEQTHTEPEPEPEPEASCAAPPDHEDSRSSSSSQPTEPHYTVKYRSVVDLQDYRCSRDSGPGARPTDIIITVSLPLLRSAQDAELLVLEQRLVLQSHKPAYKLDLPLSYPVDEDKGDAKFNKTKKQLTITLPVQPARSTELQQTRCDEMKSEEEEDQIRCDEMKRSEEEEDQTRCDEMKRSEEEEEDQNPRTSNEEVLETELNCSIVSPSAGDTAGLQQEPLASQLIDLTTEPQTPDHLQLICSVETDNEDGTHINRAVASPNTKCSSESEIQTHVKANAGDEDVHEVSGALHTENTASDANALFPHQTLDTDDTALNQQLNHEEDQSSSQDEPETRRSSEDHESTAEETASADGVILREIERDGRDVFICSHKTSAALCFQNSLWSDLD